jgi:broad specificity phosphatase PhoE
MQNVPAHRLLYFVRHGETDWNAEQRLQGQRDVPLNGRGRRQAAVCGSVLHRLIAAVGRTADEFAFISSPLVRARETMEILRTRFAITLPDYTTDGRLVEMSFGQWEGLTYTEVRARDPAVLRARERDKWNFRPPDGESYAQLLERVREWHTGLTGDAIVSAHGGVARVLTVLLGIRPAAEAPLGSVGQGVVYEFAPGVMHCHA